MCVYLCVWVCVREMRDEREREREREKVPGKIFLAGVNFYSLSSFGSSFSCLIRILFKVNGVLFKLATRGMF